MISCMQSELLGQGAIKKDYLNLSRTNVLILRAYSRVKAAIVLRDNTYFQSKDARLDCIQKDFIQNTY